MPVKRFQQLIQGPGLVVRGDNDRSLVVTTGSNVFPSYDDKTRGVI